MLNGYGGRYVFLIGNHWRWTEGSHWIGRLKVGKRRVDVRVRYGDRVEGIHAERVVEIDLSRRASGADLGQGDRTGDTGNLDADCAGDGVGEDVPKQRLTDVLATLCDVGGAVDRQLLTVEQGVLYLNRGV